MFNSLVIDYMTKVIHWKSDMTRGHRTTCVNYGDRKNILDAR